MKQSGIVLGLDLDGVLFDLMSAIFSGCRERDWISADMTQDQLQEWEVCHQFNITEDMLRQILSADLYRALDVYPEEAEDVRRWIRNGVPTIFITARSEDWTPGITRATLDALDRNGLLEGTLGVQFINTSRKHTVADRYRVGVYVDDHPLAIDSMKGRVSHPILLARPWNKKETFRHGWDHVRDTVESVILPEAKRGCSCG